MITGLHLPGYISRNNKTDGFLKVGRKDARAIGQSIFWPGKPCKKGHVDWGYTNGQSCISCAKAKLFNRIYKTSEFDTRRKLDRLADQPDLEDDYGL